MSEKKEYIERGALIAFVKSVRQRLTTDSKDFFTRDEMLLNFQQYIEHRPAADVEPVVRGEWEDVYMSSASSFVGTCSVCHQSNDIPPPQNAHYCPNCGAHMERSGSGE